MTIEVLERPKEQLKTHQREEILNSLTKEIPQRQIAHQYDTSQTTISRINRESKEIIDQRKQELLSQLPSVVESVTKDIKTNGRLSTDFNDNIDSLTVAEKLQLKAQLDKTSVNILKISGIFPSQALLNINQYNQDNRSINIEPSIMDLFSCGFSDSMQVVDMNEVSDSNDNSEES